MAGCMGIMGDDAKGTMGSAYDQELMLRISADGYRKQVGRHGAFPNNIMVGAVETTRKTRRTACRTKGIPRLCRANIRERREAFLLIMLDVPHPLHGRLMEEREPRMGELLPQ